MIRRINNIIKKSTLIIKDDGALRFAKRAAKYAYYKKFPDRKIKNTKIYYLLMAVHYLIQKDIVSLIKLSS